MQKQSIVKFLFYYDFYFWQYTYNTLTGQETSPNTPLTRYVDKLIVVNTYCKLKMKNIMILKGMFNVCSCTIFLLKFWIFFKLLVKHTLTSVVDKLLHHINVVKINYANTVTNTVIHTLSIIIISLFVFTKT